MRHLRIPLLLLIGLALGLGTGLYLGWELFPTEFVDANPAFLNDSYQEDYVRLIAAAYAVEGDLPLAHSRIDTLGAEGEAILTSVMLDTILARQNETEIRQLVNLAAALGVYSPAMDPYLNPSPEETS